MDEQSEKSSLPLLLGITACVVAVAGGGWLYLDSESPAPIENTIFAQPSGAVEPAAEDISAAPTEAAEAEPAMAEATLVDAELRKARLAAEADVLVYPERESALYYFGRALEADPDNAIVRAELDSVLTRIEVGVQQQLENEDYSGAYRVVEIVKGYSPDHALVSETLSVLDDKTESYVAAALDEARNGNDDAAQAALAAASALPGRNRQYLNSVASSIEEIRASRAAAERERRARAQLADEAAKKAAWVDAVRAAISDGNILSPADASAVDILAEENDWNDERAALSAELRDAAEAAVAPAIEGGNLDMAEEYLALAADGGSADSIANLRTQLDAAHMQAESNRIVELSALTRITAVAPRYPKRALRHNKTGWVEVHFTVLTSGATGDIEVVQSEPEDVFNNAAIKAVEQWVFEPFEYRGQVIPKRTGTRVVFNLE